VAAATGGLLAEVALQQAFEGLAMAGFARYVMIYALLIPKVNTRIID